MRGKVCTCEFVGKDGVEDLSLFLLVFNTHGECLERSTRALSLLLAGKFARGRPTSTLGPVRFCDVEILGPTSFAIYTFTFEQYTSARQSSRVPRKLKTMAKTKPQNRKSKKKANNGTSASKPKASPEELLVQAATLLQTSQPEEALVAARRALNILQPSSTPSVAALPALNLLGEINVELGDPESAREAFEVAIALDPEGASDGAEKFLWMAQLNDEGGAESIRWFERGVAVLKREIIELEGKSAQKTEVTELLEEKKQKVANSLCGVAEVYMTDLSWEEDAEARCEAAVTEALLFAPNNPEPLQTLASIRISQLRHDDAKAALARSMDLWKDLDPDDAMVPDFSTRISLSRLLMEAELEDEAIEVLERLIGENDGSVEAWYLGGWCLHLLAGKQKAKGEDYATTATSLLRASRDWLENCLKLYTLLEYEDERLKEHADEILKELNDTLGPSTGEEEEEWEDAGEDEDEEDDEEMDGT
jgi:tetratricopeptide (TPR) repeat protein